MKIENGMIVLDNVDRVALDLLKQVKDGTVTFAVIDRPDMSDPTNCEVWLVPEGVIRG